MASRLALALTSSAEGFFSSSISVLSPPSCLLSRHSEQRYGASPHTHTHTRPRLILQRHSAVVNVSGMERSSAPRRERESEGRREGGRVQGLLEDA